MRGASISQGVQWKGDYSTLCSSSAIGSDYVAVAVSNQRAYDEGGVINLWTLGSIAASEQILLKPNVILKTLFFNYVSIV